MSIRRYDFLTGVETSTFPDAQDAVSADDVPNYGQIQDEFALKSAYGNIVTSLANLKAVAAVDRFDQQLRVVRVSGVDKLYVFDSASAAAGDDDLVVVPDAGTGRWLRIYTGGVNFKDEGTPVAGGKYFDVVGTGGSLSSDGTTITLSLTGGGGGGSSSAADVAMLQKELRDEAASTRTYRGMNEIIESCKDNTLGTKVNTAVSAGQLGLTNSNLTGTDTRTKQCSVNLSSVNGLMEVNLSHFAPKDTTIAANTVIMNGDQTGYFANGKKCLFVKKSTTDGETSYQFLKNSDNTIAELTINGAPSYNAGTDETTIIFNNPSSLDLDFDLVNTQYADNLRVMPFDIITKFRSNSLAALETATISDASVKYPLTTGIGGATGTSGTFGLLAGLTGTCLQQYGAVSPTTQQYQIGITLEYQNTTNDARWYFWKSSDYGVTWSVNGTTKVFDPSDGGGNYEETNGAFYYMHPGCLAVADNGKAVWLYHRYKNTGNAHDAVYADISSGFTLNDMPTNGLGAAVMFDSGTVSYQSTGLAINKTDGSHIAMVSARADTSVVEIIQYTWTGATPVYDSGVGRVNAFTSSNCTNTTVDISGTSPTHKIHMTDKNNTNGLVAKYMTQGSGTVNSYSFSPALSAANSIMDTKTNGSYFIIFFVDNSNGDIQFGYTTLAGTTINIYSLSTNTLAANPFEGWTGDSYINHNRSYRFGIVSNPSNDAHVFFITELGHGDGSGIQRPQLYEVKNITSYAGITISQFTADGARNFRDTTTNTYIAQTFTADANPFCSFSAWLYNNSTGANVVPTGSTIQCKIYATSGGLPTGAALYTSTNSIDPNVVTTGTTGQRFSWNFDSVSLSNGTVYAAVFESAFAINATKFIKFRQNSAGGYANGQLCAYNGTSWSAVSGVDLQFEINSVWETEVGNARHATNSPWGAEAWNAESQIALVSNNQIRFVTRRIFDMNTSTAYHVKSGELLARTINISGTAGVQSTIGALTDIGYTSFDSGLVFSTALGSDSCGTVNRVTGAVTANSQYEDRSGKNCVVSSVTAVTTGTDVDFPSGKYMNFDGATSKIQITDRDLFNVMNATLPWGVEVAIKPDTTAAGNHLLIGQYAGGANPGWGIIVNGTTIVAKFTDNITDLPTVSNTGFIAASTLVFIRVIYDPSVSLFKIYTASAVGGPYNEVTYSSQPSQAAVTTQNIASPLEIGGNSGGYGFFDGRIEMVKLMRGSTTFAYTGWLNQAGFGKINNLGRVVITEQKMGQNSLSVGTSETSMDYFGKVGFTGSSKVTGHHHQLVFNHTIAGSAGSLATVEQTFGRPSTSETNGIVGQIFRFNK